jgi:GntR family transcriptional regulator
MQIFIDNADVRPIYLQIMDEIRRAVVLGTLQPEDALPSARQLAVDLRINPNTVAQAYRELERIGVVYVRRGKGTFVAPVNAVEEDRRELLRAVAERALLDGHRNGFNADELLEAIREAADAYATPTAEEMR